MWRASLYFKKSHILISLSVKDSLIYRHFGKLFTLIFTGVRLQLAFERFMFKSSQLFALYGNHRYYIISRTYTHIILFFISQKARSLSKISKKIALHPLFYYNNILTSSLIINLVHIEYSLIAPQQKVVEHRFGSLRVPAILHRDEW